jgi:hypothetical protein
MIAFRSLFLAGLAFASTAFAAPLTFTGQFAPENWSYSSEGNGFGIISEGVLTLTGSDIGDGGDGTPCEGEEECVLNFDALYTPTGTTTYAFVSVPTGGTYTFQFLYRTFDVGGAGFDRAGYFIANADESNPVFTQFSENDGPDTQVGIRSVTVGSGLIFGFFIDATDNAEGLAQLEISPANETIPEPSTYALMGGGLLGLVWMRSRR